VAYWVARGKKVEKVLVFIFYFLCVEKKKANIIMWGALTAAADMSSLLYLLY